MDSVVRLIDNHERLTDTFGCWPEFHDAEVIDLHLWRGHVAPGEWDDRNVFPVLTIKIRILQATQKGEHPKNKPDVLATIRFHDVDNFRMENFNHNNSIVDFLVRAEERGTFTNGDPLPPYLVVSFDEGFGLKSSFRCFRIEVVSAEPFAENSSLRSE